MNVMNSDAIVILILVGLVVTLIIVQITSKIKYKRISKELKLKLDYSENILKEKEVLLNQKEALFLKSSINPHLFNNALNIITSKTEKTITEAQSVIKTSEATLESIEVLSNVLKYIIYESKEQYVLLKNEVKFIEEYLKLQKIRISNDFNIKIDTDALSSYNFNNKLKVAPLICIDFIENAFKYANVKSSEGFIHVKFELIQNTLIFSVRNTKLSNNNHSGKGGFGYENLEKRLKLLYADKYSLDIKDEPELFSANLKIELHES